jgi:hypothetical protein
MDILETMLVRLRGIMLTIASSNSERVSDNESSLQLEVAGKAAFANG